MLIGKPPDIPSSEIISRDAYLRYLSRRRFLKGAAAAGVAVLATDRLSQLVSPRTTCPRRNQAPNSHQPHHHHRRAAHDLRRHHPLQQLL
ncbi:MAG: twin-arginine translocation signal domain-containing protein [Terracidiphilus sp.]